MIYLTDNDLTADSYQRFITESSGDGQTQQNVVDDCEERAISVATTYLSNRYDTETIFGQPASTDPPAPAIPPIRNELVAEIITKITLYKLFRRNAARKVSTDIKEDYDWAMAMLEKIQTGRTILNLPPALDESGKPKSYSVWGNISNRDFYI